LIKLIKQLALTSLMLTLCCVSANTLAWIGVGDGQISCATYSLALKRHNPDERMELHGETFATDALRYSTWLAGFVSGVNYQRSSTGQIAVDRNGIALWVNSYCKSHPSAALGSAVEAFVLAHDAK
jgi:hypothetical protein